MEANLAKDNESGRPSSLVSESSTVSDTDDTKDDSEQTDEPGSSLFNVKSILSINKSLSL